ncbi:MAG TPA: HAD family hydrolase [Caldisericia bacterium]|nr:HAD family hydrolase [Caldisericia bacterium]HPF49139.1 HAD family hydrolase [Caldisericia bacterium]HPI82997.1 HAD family hydrolase [Caldisericia bacterium]HPQ92224.1 HAD family hydrolase [Caldisericia bacterium]HRV74678.1 HAD family hydrolase [Caldisericia bacterium]
MTTEKIAIKGVIFDLWDTLVFDEPSIEEERRIERIDRMYDVLVKSGHIISREQLAFAYNGVDSMIAKQAKEYKALTILEQINIILEIIRLKIGKNVLARLQDAYNRPNISRLSPEVQGARKLVERLSRRYRLGLISNTERSSGEHIMQAYPSLLGRISVTYFSDVRKFRKPHPKTFFTVATELDLDPAECVMIGNSEQDDCMGAIECGMKAILFASPRLGVSSNFKPRVSSLEEIPELIQKLNK